MDTHIGQTTPDYQRFLQPNQIEAGHPRYLIFRQRRLP